ncbi:putative major facilitator superfamily MFS_1 [Candidatus Nitrososphaera gargensis Ga9.2]|uniref:Putative major facilitator superfamily MFS_1 n=1 Tax=Nitrososphaera gargensis (strain Ga9.2) TaxID=1237085 RepID=K0IC92_NITGG|nr:putative major facilitator superfamily MFS_1 [Candidatus Nitrososphaera gargensis Ga9.2]
MPSFVAAALVFANFSLGYFRLPESMRKEEEAAGTKTSSRETLATMFRTIAAKTDMKLLLATYFIAMLAFFVLDGTGTPWSKEVFGFGPFQVGLLFFFIGLVSAIVQGLVIPKLSEIFPATAAGNRHHLDRDRSWNARSHYKLQPAGPASKLHSDFAGNEIWHGFNQHACIAKSRHRQAGKCAWGNAVSLRDCADHRSRLWSLRLWLWSLCRNRRAALHRCCGNCNTGHRDEHALSQKRSWPKGDVNAAVWCECHGDKRLLTVASSNTEERYRGILYVLLPLFLFNASKKKCQNGK